MRTRCFPLLLILAALQAALLLSSCSASLPDEVAVAYDDLPELVDYNFDVKPILSDRCYQCHGPDENTRKGGLRLDDEASAFSAMASGKTAFVRGKPGQSEVFHRILSTDPDYTMPPPDSKLTLSPHEIAVIVKWLEQGAEWKPHWAFIPVPDTEVPPAHENWTQQNAIDHFIQEPLEREGMSPSEQADKEHLLRRVTMDLTGLPPTIEEIDAFLADESPEAYERVVDRLLASDAHAERLAMEWLDIARYADSQGVSFDGFRNAWPYRDWIIRAFRENMPFNEFITQQVAGDLRENPSDDEILATSFYRMNPQESSGGSIPEEYRVEYVAERTALTGTAFLGLTIGCARCHDHKFDPISQKEFYQLSAFFNSVEEPGLAMTDVIRAPTLILFTEDEKKRMDSLQQSISDLEDRHRLSGSYIQKVANYIREVGESYDSYTPVAEFSFESLTTFKRKDRQMKFVPFLPPTPEEKKKMEEMKKKMMLEGKKKKVLKEVQLIDKNKDAEATPGVTVTDGAKGKALLFDEDYDYAELFKLGNFEQYDPFSVSIWIKPDKKKKGRLHQIIGNGGSFQSGYRGWEFYLNEEDQLAVRMTYRMPDNYLEASTREVIISTDEWSQVGFTYDGSGKADGIRFFVNGRPAPSVPVADRLTRSIHPLHDYMARKDTVALRLGKSYRSSTGDEGVFRGAMDELKLFDKEISAWEMARIAGVEDEAYLSQVYEVHKTLRSEKYLTRQARLQEIRKARLAMYDSVEEVMVMRDLDKPRQTFLLQMGLYNQPGEEVSHGTPARILEYDESLPDNRLGLAAWLTDRRNPLTSRVTINRYWQMFFGKGLVKTPEDFGNQGDLPTHPALLDWLANEFMENDWDLRHMLKLMVMSHTYRQSSFATKEMLEKDPENKLYARMSSYRLPAEMIRDNALAASGLLVRDIGGPSVKPYQPDGLWKDLGDFSYVLARYRADTGRNLYRRSMYTFTRRFMPSPFMINFDATNREVCIARRETTNTPLQALNLLNDPQFVEASRVLAERIQREEEETDKQIALGYRLATGVRPAEAQLRILREQYEHSRAFYSGDLAVQADSLCMIGETPRDEQFAATETAALTLVMNTILNFDETYMKR